MTSANKVLDVAGVSKRFGDLEVLSDAGLIKRTKIGSLPTAAPGMVCGRALLGPPACARRCAASSPSYESIKEACTSSP